MCIPFPASDLPVELDFQLTPGDCNCSREHLAAVKVRRLMDGKSLLQRIEIVRSMGLSWEQEASVAGNAKCAVKALCAAVLSGEVVL